MQRAHGNEAPRPVIIMAESLREQRRIQTRDRARRRLSQDLRFEGRGLPWKVVIPLLIGYAVALGTIIYHVSLK